MLDTQAYIEASVDIAIPGEVTLRHDKSQYDPRDAVNFSRYALCKARM